MSSKNTKTTPKTANKKAPQKKKTPRKKPTKVNSVPAASSLTINTSKPKTVQRRNCYVVSHLEYLGDIIGSTAPFAISATYSINPALPGTFPWLSPIASAYESYKFSRLDFIYAGRVSSSVGGYCTLALDFDPTDPVPISKAEVNNFNDRVAVVPWCTEARLHARNDGLARVPKYLTRSTSVAGELGIYDVGTLYVVVGGQASTTVIGELWAQYTIEFYVPQTNRAGPLQARNNAAFTFLADVPYNSSPTVVNVPFSATLYNPFGFTNTGGVLTGVTGVFTVYTQLLITAASLSIAQAYILKNNVGVQSAIFPPLNTGNFSSVNIQFVVALNATDTLSIGFNATGTGIVLKTGIPAGSNATFQITPA